MVNKLNVNLNIKDVMERQGSFVTMNSKLAFVVTNIRLRVQAYQARIEEMQKFVDQGALYDEQVGELLVQVESKRAFVFRIDPCYPFGGLESIKVVGVEPDYGGEVEKWNSKLKSMNGRLSDAITLFE
jgi:hypothetical protein